MDFSKKRSTWVDDVVSFYTLKIYLESKGLSQKRTLELAMSIHGEGVTVAMLENYDTINILDGIGIFKIGERDRLFLT
jgi:hypothetical protein